jgi:hypothetical protein
MWGLFGGLAFVGGSLIDEDPVLANCSGASQLPPSIPAANTATKPGVTLRAGETTVIPFGRRPGALSTVALFDVTGSARPMPVILNNFKRSDGAVFKYVPGDGDRAASITATDSIIGNTLELRLCADRTLAHADSGTYTGNVALIGGGLASPVTLPVTLTLSDSRTSTLVPVYFTFILIIGSAYGWMLDTQLTGDEHIFETSHVKKYFEWFWSLSGVLAIIFGLAAATGVFKAQYLSANDWGSTGWEYIALAISMLGGFVSAATVARVPFSRKGSPI